jgi:biopolymer transport protein ExbD
VLEAPGGGKPKLKINQDDIEWDKLSGRLTEIFKTRAERVMFVKGDPEIEFQHVAKVIDTAKGTEVVERVGLITAKIEAGQ